jgi:hypothetical protein
MKSGKGTAPIFEPYPNLGRGAISEVALTPASAGLSIMCLLDGPVAGLSVSSFQAEI